jgi:hypothetical protein
VRSLRWAGLLLLLAGCHAGLDPARLLGRWVNTRDSVEFFPDGSVLFETPAGRTPGSYGRPAPGEIRVDLGSRDSAGDPQRWYALPRGDHLLICELRNYRHCMQFHRHGAISSRPPR